MRILITRIVFCLLVFSANSYAVDPTLDWKTIENENLFVHYAEGNKVLAEKALAIAEAAHQRLTVELDWQPKEKTHVVLSDETDQPNGFATPLFFNRTVLYLAPPTSVNTLEDFDDWLTTLIFHEYTHIVHLDKSDGSPEGLRNIFGRFLFLFPNLFQPSWVIEGVGTHKETDLERGIGRGQSTMFASMMREEVVKGLQPVSHVNLPVSTWPAGTTRYLYGVYFMAFIADQYGEEKLQQWIDEYSNNLLPFFINTNANTVLGKNLTPLWIEYQQWLSEKFQPQIDFINSQGITNAEQVSVAAYRTTAVEVVDKKTGSEIYYLNNAGYKRASLMRINADGKQEELLSLNGDASFDAHPSAGLLITQDEFCNNYTVYKDIYLYDEVDNELKRLTECGRYLFASWTPDAKGIVAVHHHAGKFEIHLLNAKAKQQKVLWQADNEEVIGQIDVSPDGDNIVATVWRKGSGWNLELFNLKEKKWKKLTTGANITANPGFDSAGNILFSLEENNAYNLYRYNLATAEIQQLTNLIGGAFQSSQTSVDQPIYYVGYSAEGYAIYKTEDISIGNPVVNKDRRLELINYDITEHESKNYSALSNMYPRWWFPTFQFTEQRSELGVTTTGGDALGIHNYSLSASYDSKLNKPAAQVSYGYADRLFLSAIRINEITLDANSQLNRISA